MAFVRILITLNTDHLDVAGEQFAVHARTRNPSPMLVFVLQAWGDSIWTCSRRSHHSEDKPWLSGLTKPC